MLDLTTEEHLTEMTVPQDVLEPGTTYSARVRFFDEYLEASEWSHPIQFTTTSTVVDIDADGIPDDDETYVYGTDPSTLDTDGDGIGDGDELTYWGDYWNSDFDGDGLFSLIDPDADGDGFLDGIEINQGSDPGDALSFP